MKPQQLLVFAIFRYAFSSIFLIFFALQLSAQKHDYNWVAGYPPNNIIIKFQGDTVAVEKANLNMPLSLGSFCFSDSEGNMLFYTCGGRVFDKSRNLMKGGDSLNFGFFWENTITDGYASLSPPIAMFLPQNDSLVYLIHSRIENNPTFSSTILYALNYSIINIRANNGLGQMLEKNKTLMDGDLIELAATKHGNGRDWWITSADRSNPKQYTFLLNPQGIQAPLIQDMLLPFDTSEFLGWSVFSPDGSLYVRNDGNVKNAGVRVMDFDRCTGQFSNLRAYPVKGLLENTWSAIFSENNRYLYLNNVINYVVTIDLESPIDSTEQFAVGEWEIAYAPEWPYSVGFIMSTYAPTQKIFWSGNYNQHQALTIMHRPNLPGDAVNFEQIALDLPELSCSSFRNPNYRLGKKHNSGCDSLLVSDAYKTPLAQNREQIPYRIAKYRNTNTVTRTSKHTINMMDYCFAYSQYQQKKAPPKGWTLEEYEQTFRRPTGESEIQKQIPHNH